MRWQTRLLYQTIGTATTWLQERLNELRAQASAAARAAVEFTGLYQRSQDRPIFGAVIVTGEQRILARKSHHPFILPMSGKSWKSITGGTPILAAKSAYGAWSNERRVDF